VRGRCPTSSTCQGKAFCCCACMQCSARALTAPRRPHACPCSVDTILSHAAHTAPTQPEPFHLATEDRGASYRHTLAARLAADEAAARKARVRPSAAARAQD
jgi:hypothetical protein